MRKITEIYHHIDFEVKRTPDGYRGKLRCPVYRCGMTAIVFATTDTGPYRGLCGLNHEIEIPTARPNP